MWGPGLAKGARGPLRLGLRGASGTGRAGGRGPSRSLNRSLLPPAALAPAHRTRRARLPRAQRLVVSYDSREVCDG